MKYLVLFLVALSLFSCNRYEPLTKEVLSTTEITPVLSDSARIAPFVLEGHSILSYAKGDINRDGLEDFVLVQKMENEDEIGFYTDFEDTRPLIILLSNDKGELLMKWRNDKIVLCYQCGGVYGDPFNEVLIDEEGLSISHYGGSAWRWGSDLRFEYNKESDQLLFKSEHGFFYHNINIDETMEKSTVTADPNDPVDFQEYNRDE